MNCLYISPVVLVTYVFEDMETKRLTPLTSFIDLKGGT